MTEVHPYDAIKCGAKAKIFMVARKVFGAVDYKLGPSITSVKTGQNVPRLIAQQPGTPVTTAHVRLGYPSSDHSRIASINHVDQVRQSKGLQCFPVSLCSTEAQLVSIKSLCYCVSSRNPPGLSYMLPIIIPIGSRPGSGQHTRTRLTISQQHHASDATPCTDVS